MIGIYFSGTGNTKFCIDEFIKQYDNSQNTYSIEDKETLAKIENSQDIVIGYPVQYSNIPKILRDYIETHSEVWRGKRIFVIATMGLFSGDGAGILGRLLKKYGANIVGGLHLTMPDSIADEKVLKRSIEKNKKLVQDAKMKISRAVNNMKDGNSPQEGLGIVSCLIGLFGQRLYFFGKTKKYTDHLKINHDKCVSCGICVKLCPMNNISSENGIVIAGAKCTMCYRCINRCPKQAITLLGKEVIEQNDINMYL